jgi:hypothetical protein
MVVKRQLANQMFKARKVTIVYSRTSPQDVRDQAHRLFDLLGLSEDILKPRRRPRRNRQLDHKSRHPSRLHNMPRR